VPGEEDLRRVAVAQPDDRPREAGGRVRKARELRVAGGGHGGRDGRGVVLARALLLHVAPEVRLHVHHRARVAHPPQRQAQVGVVRLHEPLVAQVREVALCLVAAARPGLQQHVVGEDGQHARALGLRDVARDERAFLVPRRPSVAGVDAAGEVLVPRVEPA
jgi:hypothetical protein